MWELLIIQPLTNLLLWIYDVLGHGPHMFGLAIILFTVLIKVIHIHAVDGLPVVRADAQANRLSRTSGHDKRQ